MQHARLVSVLCVAAAVAACSDPLSAPVDRPSLSVGGESKSYVIVASSTLPSDIAARVSAAGGVLESTMPGIGVAVASSASPSFARTLKGSGIQDVVPDMVVQWTNDREAAAEVEIDPAELLAGDAQTVAGDAAAMGALETYRAIQWAPDAVSAPAAWAAGQMGQNVRVAVLDGGIHRTHVDIAPRMDLARSRSFVPTTIANWDYFQDVGTFWHGTHVAGIIAAPANNIGTVGIAPAATIIGVKVLHNGSGAFSWIINGIYYASTPIAEGGAGADIINMSLGAAFDRQGRDAAMLLVALGRATTYAYQHGTTVIASAGNDATDIDHTNNLVVVPAQSPHVIAVAATAPLGWAVPGNVFDLDRPASYTNFGQSAIAFAGPGGDAALPGTDICSKPRNPSGSVVQYCWVLDMVMAPCRGSGTSTSSYCWAAGTSMASPAVAGVAALAIASHGGHLSPAEVRDLLTASSDDLGKPGNDDYYGGGRVNALRVITAPLP